MKVLLGILVLIILFVFPSLTKALFGVLMDVYHGNLRLPVHLLYPAQTALEKTAEEDQRFRIPEVGKPLSNTPQQLSSSSSDSPLSEPNPTTAGTFGSQEATPEKVPTD